MVRLFSILELSDVPLLSGCYSCKWNIINQSGNIIQKGNTQTSFLKDYSIVWNESFDLSTLSDDGCSILFKIEKSDNVSTNKLGSVVCQMKILNGHNGIINLFLSDSKINSTLKIRGNSKSEILESKNQSQSISNINLLSKVSEIVEYNVNEISEDVKDIMSRIFDE